MKLYDCLYVNEEGEEKKSSFSASSVEELNLIFQKKNLYLIEYKEVKERKKENKKNYILFLKDMSFLLNTKLPLPTILNLLINKYKSHKILKSFYLFISNELKKGELFSFSLKNQNYIKIKEEVIELISVAEKTNSLKKLFEELRVNLEEEDKVKKDIKKILIYPTILISVSILVFFIIFVFVIPQMSSMYQDNGQELPYLTEMLISFSNFTKESIHYAIFGVFGLIMGIRSLLKINKYKYLFDRFLIKNKITSKFIQKLEFIRFLLVFNMYVNANETIVDSISVSNKNINNLYLKEILEEVVKSIKEGKKITNAFNDVFEKYEVKLEDSFLDSVFVSESNSDFKTYFNLLRKELIYNLKDNQKTFMSLLEPIIILVLGFLVGLVTIGMLLPIFYIEII